MDEYNILDLLFAVDHALAFIDRYRDTETDPDSDIGAQVPNEACRVYAMLQEAAETVNADLEVRSAADRLQRAIDAAEHARSDR